MEPYEALAAYGVEQGGAIEARLHSVSSPSDSESADRPHELLGALMNGVVQGDVLPNLEVFRSNWHTAGFMVYYLGVHGRFGSLRLHVWPRGLRRIQVLGDDPTKGGIHDHSWKVNGYCIENYKDEVYEVARQEIGADRRFDQAKLRVSEVVYSPDGRDSIRMGDECVSATVREARSMRPGRIHVIEPGVYHCPTVPENEFAATLVMNSQRKLRGGPHVLLSGPVESFTVIRREIDSDEIQLAKSQLKEKL
ncbi:hypothetical protein ACIOD2_07885 [Amycolatopsis sp. NPDC088138]|uniref:hypothetical protein n=1 Tax=Amycolatopsis sp. NPDC088138 TaxID=3363938 RepID=UPI0038119CAB